jgi:hypothetical protein
VASAPKRVVLKIVSRTVISWDPSRPAGGWLVDVTGRRCCRRPARAPLVRSFD